MNAILTARCHSSCHLDGPPLLCFLALNMGCNSHTVPQPILGFDILFCLCLDFLGHH